MKPQHLPKRPTGIRLLILAQYPKNIFLCQVLKKEEKETEKASILMRDIEQFRLDEVFEISRIIKVEVSVKADNTYRDLDYYGYHKNQI